MNITMKKLDDLTIIKGIGPTRQEWLRTSFHIRTYGDLAALSPDEIEAQLKAAGRIAARRAIEAWIAQAQLLAAPVSPGLPHAQAASRPEAATAANVPSERNQWDAVASYVVEFQTRLGETLEKKTQEYRTAVHHMEADVGKAWPGIKTDELCAWMLDQVRENEVNEPTTEFLVEPKPAVRAPLQVVISHIGVFQRPDIATQIMVSEISRPFQGIINGDEPFALEIAFELTEQGATDVANREIRYSAQFHGHNLATGASIYLGDVKDAVLMAGKGSGVARLSNISLRPGIYRLRIVVVLQSRPPKADYIEVPLLQVM